MKHLSLFVFSLAVIFTGCANHKIVVRDAECGRAIGTAQAQIASRPQDTGYILKSNDKGEIEFDVAWWDEPYAFISAPGYQSFGTRIRDERMLEVKLKHSDGDASGVLGELPFPVSK